MAREEQDREDLMREATALVRRIELRVPGEPHEVVVGFRRDGACSFFFGPDPVYQFNACGELRRGYVGGKLLKAEAGRLVAMTRVRTATETQLVRSELDVPTTTAILTTMTTRLTALRDFLHSKTAIVVQQVPPAADVGEEVERELTRLLARPQIAATPRAGGGA